MAGSSTLIVLLTLIAASSVSAQRTCYQCSGTYQIDSDEDVGNCFTTTDDTNTVSCDGQCNTGIYLGSSSITISRSCQSTDDLGDCNDCTNKKDCLLCCSSADKCNSDALLTLLETKALTQTCFSCRFSEIPGVESYSACALDFQEDGDGIDTVHCPGMCYSSYSYIPGIEDVVRGCAYYGNGCDADYYSDSVYGITERNNVRFKRSCCMGDKCNSAMAINPGMFTLMISIIWGMFACYLV